MCIVCKLCHNVYALSDNKEVIMPFANILSCSPIADGSIKDQLAGSSSIDLLVEYRDLGGNKNRAKWFFSQKTRFEKRREGLYVVGVANSFCDNSDEGPVSLSVRALVLADGKGSAQFERIAS